MPFGLHIVGRFRGDLELLGISRAMEREFAKSPDLQRPRPHLSDMPVAVPSLKSIVTAPPIYGDLAVLDDVTAPT
jgi:hypothetical protein